MRARVTVAVFVWAILLAVIVGASLGLAARADASPETDFLDILTDNGLTVYDASTAVDIGYNICAAFDRGYNGADVAEAIYANSSYGDVPDLDTAALWVIAAGQAMCPWHYHPERANASDVRISSGVGGRIGTEG